MYFVEFILAWELNSISFPKHSAYKPEDPWQAVIRERRANMNPMVLSEQVSSEKKNSGKDFPDSSVKDFLATCWITQRAVDKKNILNNLGALFKLSLFIFLEGLHKVGLMITED